MWVEFPNSAHALLREEPGRLSRFLGETVLPAALGRMPDKAERCSGQPGDPTRAGRAESAAIGMGRKTDRIASSGRGEG